MAMKTARNDKARCGLCNQWIDRDKYGAHANRCQNTEDEYDNQSDLKTCPFCDKQVRDLARHCQTCSVEDGASNHTSYAQRHSPYSSAAHSPKTTRSTRRNDKKCPTCSEMIDENDYPDHILDCATPPRRKSPPRRTKVKKCPTCSDDIDDYNFEKHVERCDGRPARRPEARKRYTKRCPTCSDDIDEYDFDDHIDRCHGRSARRPEAKKRYTKRCPTCSDDIDEYDFERHVDRCDRRSTRRRYTKRCPTCSDDIDEYDFDYHIDRCNKQSSRTSIYETNTKNCPVCYKDIEGYNFQKHVNECADKLAPRKPQKTCFTCSKPVDESRNSSHTMPCRTSHIYCLNCLERSMNELIQSNTAPVCHTAFCDYELSLYDVECLPVQADVKQRLLPLVKNTQRPQCPFCQFYVEFKTMDDLNRHAAACTPDNMEECEFCHCLHNKNRLMDHRQQCRNESRSQQQQALIAFMLPRTKYPITPQQLRVFLDYRRSNHLPSDLRSLINALAEFGGTFPFEVPTRNCDICTDAYVYDDIFVFGCEENHKLCYTCFADSCAQKKNSNEILTCPMCAYQLTDGEIKQLRIPAEQKRELIDYQTQKLFSTYAGGTQGVIRCPNQGCKWVAEAKDPDDRFQVECPLCEHQFCSLCNQQYHFRTTCQQIPEITQRWFFWCNTERGNYWQARAQQDANFRAQLEDYERQRAANEQRNQELQQRYNDLIADEQYKAQNCRICPNCNRVVQHLGGCDLMICGQNYHGGDQQSGCGRRFNWSQATPYAPLANTGPQQVANDIVAPEQQQAVVHEGIECDSCHNQVEGIRFDCVHCASLIFCERCEQRATLEHSNQIRDQNKAQHVFRLIPRPL